MGFMRGRAMVATMRRVKDLHELVLQGADRADALVVLLHGLGADGADLQPLGAAMLAALPGARIVLPTAPRRPVGIAGGLPMRAWFDVGPADILRTHASDPAGVAQAEGWLRGLLEREARSGIPTTRMVVGGFSQGGALAAWFAPRHSLPLAGVMALSTFMATNAPFEAEVHAANRALPAFVAHGRRDDVVAHGHGVALRDRLARAGLRVAWRDYELGHAIDEQVALDAAAWLAATLGR
jgi:phospholipase/carboxylesterase